MFLQRNRIEFKPCFVARCEIYTTPIQKGQNRANLKGKLKMFIRLELIRGNAIKTAKIDNVTSYEIADNLMKIYVGDAVRIISLINILYCDVLPENPIKPLHWMADFLKGD